MLALLAKLQKIQNTILRCIIITKSINQLFYEYLTVMPVDNCVIK